MAAHAYNQFYLQPSNACYSGGCNQQINKCDDKIAGAQEYIIHARIKVEHIKEEQLRHQHNGINSQGKKLQNIKPFIIAGKQQQQTIDNKYKTEVDRYFWIT